MKHSCLINGYDTLNLTKLDVLDDLEEIKVGVKYMVNDQELSGFPGMSQLTTVVSGSLTVRFCSGPGRSRASRSGLPCTARMEDIDPFSQEV